MHRHSSRTWSLASSLLSLFSFPIVLARPSLSHAHVPRQYGDRKQIDQKDGHNDNFFRFVTRPDIDAPRWTVKVHDRDAVSPGYWFLGVYENVNQPSHGEAWIGPHIYDQTGELVWSGAPMFKGFDAFDFKLSNFGGKEMMTFIYPHDNAAMIMDNTYEVFKKVEFDNVGLEVNMHDFNLVDNGTRALALHNNHKDVPQEKLAFSDYDGDCRARFTGFEVLDTKTWELMFTWSPYDHINMGESTKTDRSIKNMCRNTWDFFHPNTIDSFPDGDYLLSSRYFNTAFKISGEDGHIVWRFGGTDNVISDFKFDNHFSGQHDTRVRSQNETHTVISLVDNAWSPGKPSRTNDESRGLLISLRTDVKPMTAEVVAEYKHPHGDYAPGRGNLQYMDNGNAFLAWWKHAIHSEHSPDGKTIMEAQLKPQLKSYRNYKFPWVGHPKQPPDVHSAAVRAGDDVMTTLVHVSWNGATEVASWNLYKTNAEGNINELIASTPRQGFESALACSGYATFVVAEALDRNNDSLGKSEIVKTIPPGNMSDVSAVEEAKWLQDHSWDTKLGMDGNLSILVNPIFTFFGGIMACTAAVTVAFVFYVVWTGKWRTLSDWQQTGSLLWWRRKEAPQVYEPLWEGDTEVEDFKEPEDDIEAEKADEAGLLAHRGEAG